MKQFYEIPESSDDFIDAIRMRHPAWNILVKNEHQSTQLMAKELFHNGLDDYALCILRNQTGGRGRQDRGWKSSPDGKDLTMSLLFPSILRFDNPSLLNLIGGVSVVEALHDLTSLEFKAKWPNDIFFRSSKIGGIISELMITDDAYAIIMGIGVNVNSPKDYFKDENSFYTIDTVSSITGKALDFVSLIVEIMDRLQSNLVLLDDEMFDLLQKKWMAIGLESGVKIRYREISGNWEEGYASGINHEGYLLVRKDKESNVVKELIEGDVVPIYE